MLMWVAGGLSAPVVFGERVRGRGTMDGGRGDVVDEADAATGEGEKQKLHDALDIGAFLFVVSRLWPWNSWRSLWLLVREYPDAPHVRGMNN